MMMMMMMKLLEGYRSFLKVLEDSKMMYNL